MQQSLQYLYNQYNYDGFSIVRMVIDSFIAEMKSVVFNKGLTDLKVKTNAKVYYEKKKKT